MKKLNLILISTAVLLLCLFAGPLLASSFGLLKFWSVFSGVLFILAFVPMKQNALYTTLCGVISANILYDCANPIQGGAESTLYIFNKADIAAFTTDSTNPNIVRSITMASAKLGFKFEGYKKSLKPKTTGKLKNFGYYWMHEVDFLILANSSAVKAQVEALAAGYYIAIIVNKQKTSDSAVEIFGLSQGLSLTDGALRDVADANTEGAWSLKIASEAGYEEPHTAASFAVLTTGSTPVFDYAGTITALDALITP